MPVRKWSAAQRKKHKETWLRKREGKGEGAKQRKSLTVKSQPNLSDWDIAYVYGKTEAFIEFYAAQRGISQQTLATELGKLLQANRKRLNN